MPQVAKRKLRQSWRDAVAERAGQDEGCLPAFDALLRDGVEEGEAAFRVLDARHLLWLVDEPGGAAPTAAGQGNIPAI